MELRLVPHSPLWAREFAAEAGRIREAAGGRLLGLEHVGSTAVPGLLGKPVVDVALAVESEEVADALVAPFQALGYEYRGPYGDDPARRYYVLNEAGVRRFQLHLWILPARGWREQVGFRDLLRGRPDLRDSYAGEKLRVAAEVGGDKAAYAEAKGPFVERLLRESGLRPSSPNRPVRPSPEPDS